jgi:glyoxylase-like metal-dependent hydrolase (beta-lactamase superfamily II)
VVFAADLIPGRPWVHVPITMGYDRFPELLIDEKAALLADLVARGGRLFFTHDPTSRWAGWCAPRTAATAPPTRSRTSARPGPDGRAAAVYRRRR